MKRMLGFALLGGAALACGTVRTQSQESFRKPDQLMILDLPVPKLTGEAKDWLNTEGKPVAFKKGRVYVVHFWTFG